MHSRGDNPCTRSVCRAAAHTAKLIPSSPSDRSDMAWGTGTADVWYLGCYGVVFSTRAGAQLPANDSHGSPVQCTAEQGTRQEKSIAKPPAARSHPKGETARWKLAEAGVTAEGSIVKCQAHSFLISHKEKNTWQIQPSPEPE